MISDIFNKIKDKFAEAKRTASYDTKKIDKKLDKEKPLLVSYLNSKRYYGKGSDGHYTDDDATVASLDEYDGDTMAEIPSTAVKNVKYDPKTKTCSVLFVGGDKWYDYQMSPQQFKSFMAASSKGRYVNNVMKHKNRMPGY